MKGRPPKSHITPSRKIWVDADACPASILEVLFRVAEGRRMVVTLVASQPQQWPHCAYIRSLVVPSELDAVKNRIDTMINEGDLVITGDASLAQNATRKKASPLDPNGKDFGDDLEALQQSAHTFMLSLHDAANQKRAPEALRQKNQIIFAGQLNHLLSRYTTSAPSVAVTH